MALYRNIAGFSPNSQVGLLLNLQGSTALPPPTGGGTSIIDPSTVTLLPPGTLPVYNPTTSATIVNPQIQDAYTALAAAKQSNYNYLLSTDPVVLTQSGYYVDDYGNVQHWASPDHTQSSTYLALEDIQDIENSAGTAGTLFMHLGLPLMAKDTAGYAGGAMASQGATHMYSTPIADVLAIPAAPTGPNVIQDYNPPQTTPPVISPGTTTTQTGSGIPVTTTTPTSTLTSGDTLGVVALGLAAIAVARSKKLLFVGGLGLLYYSMSKTQNL